MYWDTLKAHYEKWTRPAFREEAAASADTEYWCPMHPTIIRDHPDKCPICGMPLSKRKKGEAGAEEPLPPGVISRVQLTPYRVALANANVAVRDLVLRTPTLDDVFLELTGSHIRQEVTQ